VNRKDLILGDSLDLLIDNRGKNPPFTSQGVPVVSGMAVGGGRLDLTVAKAVSTETWKRWMPAPTRTHDVILTSEAPLGRVALVPDDEPLTLGQRVFGLRGKYGVLDSRYLYYAFSTAQVQADLYGRATGTTVVGIRQPSLRRVRIPAPDYADQIRIAEVLGALDDKIAANSTFAKASGDLAEAMYARLVTAETTDVALGEILTLEYGKSLPLPSRHPGEVAVYGSGGVVGRHDAALVDGPGVVVGRKGTAGAVHWASGPHFPIDTTFFASPNSPDVPLTYCYFALRSLRLDEMNSDSAVPGLNRNQAHAARLRMPSPVDRKKFDASAAPLFRLSAQSASESVGLACLRDALLPQLMSGKIRVKAAERVVEGVV